MWNLTTLNLAHTNISGEQSWIPTELVSESVTVCSASMSSCWQPLRLLSANPAGALQYLVQYMVPTAAVVSQFSRVLTKALDGWSPWISDVRQVIVPLAAPPLGFRVQAKGAGVYHCLNFMLRRISEHMAGIGGRALRDQIHTIASL